MNASHDPKTSAALSLHDAARSIADSTLSLLDAEARLIQAIERGRLRANVKRWGTEQWAGDGLSGNINPRETRIERAELAAWCAGEGLRIQD